MGVLSVMGIGYLGVFLVTGVIILAVTIMNRFADRK